MPGTDEMSPFPVTLAVPPRRWHVHRDYVLIGPPELPEDAAWIMGVGGMREIELPDEVFPDVEQLDLDDRGAIHEFVSKFGFMNVFREVFTSAIAEFTDEKGGRLLYFLPIERDMLASATSARDRDEAGRRAGGLTDLEREWQEVAKEAGISPAPPMPDSFAFKEGGPVGEQVQDFRVAASMVRLGSLLIVELHSGRRFSLSRVRIGWPAHCPWPMPATKTEARKMLEHLLNIGLAYQTISVELSNPGGGAGSFSASLLRDTRESLFARITLEFLQALAQGHPIRTCAHCGRSFSHMEGGSRYRQPRRDAKYCSPPCRTSYNSAAHRRRQRSRLAIEGDS